VSDICSQLQQRPISQEQLLAEVEGIFAGLKMVEAKCMEVDKKLALHIQNGARTKSKLNNKQWQALIALHRTLLYEHHDFLLASQHPSATLELRELALEHDIPARLWHHGVHSFLQILQQHLPASLDFLLAFLYLSYSMMTLLYETVPRFADTWVQYLGDISQYIMALEDDDSQDREVWACNAHHWHSKICNTASKCSTLCQEK